jgi:hypothetical protein
MPTALTQHYNLENLTKMIREHPARKYRHLIFRGKWQTGPHHLGHAIAEDGGRNCTAIPQARSNDYQYPGHCCEQPFPAQRGQTGE